MRCRKAQQSVSARLDGELPASLERPLADHLASCPACAAFAEDLAGVEVSLGGVTAPDVRSGFADRLMARLDGESATISRIRPWFAWASPAPLAAALIAFGCGVGLAVLADADVSASAAINETATSQSPLEQEYGEALAEVSLDTDLLALLTDAEG